MGGVVVLARSSPPSSTTSRPKSESSSCGNPHSNYQSSAAGVENSKGTTFAVILTTINEDEVGKNRGDLGPHMANAFG